jgi:hypothetical protein
VVALKEKTGFPRGCIRSSVTGVFGREQVEVLLPVTRISAMRDIKSDWKRWSRAERVGAIAIIATLLVSGSSLVQALAG